jgi:hypothetical protein
MCPWGESQVDVDAHETSLSVLVRSTMSSTWSEPASNGCWCWRSRLQRRSRRHEFQVFEVKKEIPFISYGPVMLLRLLREPPFRLLAKVVARHLPLKFSHRVYWEGLDRPHYAFGAAFAASQAARLGLKAVMFAEFGVAQGDGLILLQRYAALAEEEYCVNVTVVGFDLGSGLPAASDYRDHPDIWHKGQYAMDVARLRTKLSGRTQLILGDVYDTVPQFFLADYPPIGFAAIDLDLYSSTRSALHFLILQNAALPHTALYFDDVVHPYNHRFAGELAAIDDFNRDSDRVKIDRWRGLRNFVAFPESAWLEQMYIAHQLDNFSTQPIATASPRES